MPSTTLFINYATSADIQNTASQLSISTSDSFQVDDLSVSPLQLAKYFLYNRDLGRSTDYGRDVEGYLRYPGGFITVGDKVNTKYGNLTIEKNLTVTLSANLNKGFDIFNKNGVNKNRIKNIRQIPTAIEFYKTYRDDELVTVGDFKKYGYYRGMIVMWSGTWENLRENLPFWRLCAAPDAGFNVESGVTVPNLQGLFIMGGSYTPSQSFDNYTPPRPFSTPTAIGDTGGANSVTLTQNQLKTHKHDYSVTFGGGFSTLKSYVWNGVTEGAETTNSFVYGGGALVVPAQPYTISGGAYTTVCTLGQNAYTTTQVNFSYTPIVISRPSNSAANSFENRGGSLPHENRPPYYALAYIMYVGVGRPS